MFYMPISRRNWERMVEPDTIYMGFYTQAWSMQAELAMDPNTGTMSYHGLAVQGGPQGFAILPEMVPIEFFFKKPWNFTMDKLAGTGVGDFFGVEPGMENNPLRMDWFLGFLAPEKAKQVAQSGTLPAISAAVPVYAGEAVKMNNYMLENKIANKGEIDNLSPGLDFYIPTSKEEAWELIEECKPEDGYVKEKDTPSGYIFIPNEVLLGEEIPEGKDASDFNKMIKTVEYGNGNDNKTILLDSDEELKKIIEIYGEMDKHLNSDMENFVIPDSYSEAIGAESLGDRLEEKSKDGSRIYRNKNLMDSIGENYTGPSFGKEYAVEGLSSVY